MYCYKCEIPRACLDPLPEFKNSDSRPFSSVGIIGCLCSDEAPLLQILQNIANTVNTFVEYRGVLTRINCAHKTLKIKKNVTSNYLPHYISIRKLN